MPPRENEIELIGTYGSDETHALSAWTSTSRELSDEKRQRIPDLLKFLADNKHETPFEKSSLHFLITTDIASHIHILKSRIGVSLNSESARYKELVDDKYYIPVDWPQEEVNRFIDYMELSYVHYHAAVDRLIASGLTRKRAKESARFYLPYAMQYTADVMFNFRSFNHFLKLRYSMHAQVEIRLIAAKMLALVKDTGSFDSTLEAFGLTENGIIRPPFE
jgi:flavin-dependent thymidylate synthase